jgi:hypothetical protein
MLWQKAIVFANDKFFQDSLLFVVRQEGEATYGVSL